MKQQIETSNPIDSTDEEIYSVCEEIALELVNPALDHLHVFIFTLLWYCNRAGLNAQFAYLKIRTTYLPNQGKEKALTMLAGYCYDKYVNYGTINIKDKASWPKPPEITPLKRVCRYAVRLKRDGDEWDDQHIISGCKSSGLKKVLVESVYIFLDEQCGYEENFEYFVNGLETLVDNKMEIYRNVLNDTMGYRLINSKHTLKPMSANILWVYATKNGFVGKLSLKVNEIDAFLKSHCIRDYDPIAEYFRNLPAWDGKDHITKLANHVIVPKESRMMFNESFRKALIRNVGCGLGRAINRYVIVLSGTKQNTGKSTFIRYLCPPKLKQYYTEAALRGNKDDSFKLSETFIYNFEELSTLSSRDINEMKSYISAESSSERKPYDRDAKVRSRRTSFWASTNRDQFLVDETGNTRWLIFQVDDLNWNYSKAIDIDKVWAQAYHYYTNGEQGQLTAAEVEFQTQHNKEFEIRALEHEFIMEYFRPIAKEEKLAEFWTNLNLVEFFKKYTADAFRLNATILGRAMKQFGFEPDRIYIDGSTQRGYWLKRVARPNYKTGRTYCNELPERELTEEEEALNEFLVNFNDADRINAGVLTDEEVELREEEFLVSFKHKDKLFNWRFKNRTPEISVKPKK